LNDIFDVDDNEDVSDNDRFDDDIVGGIFGEVGNVDERGNEVDGDGSVVNGGDDGVGKNGVSWDCVSINICGCSDGSGKGIEGGGGVCVEDCIGDECKVCGFGGDESGGSCAGNVWGDDCIGGGDVFAEYGSGNDGWDDGGNGGGIEIWWGGNNVCSGIGKDEDVSCDGRDGDDGDNDRFECFEIEVRENCFDGFGNDNAERFEICDELNGTMGGGKWGKWLVSKIGILFDGAGNTKGEIFGWTWCFNVAR